MPAVLLPWLQLLPLLAACGLALAAAALLALLLWGWWTQPHVGQPPEPQVADDKAAAASMGSPFAAAAAGVAAAGAAAGGASMQQLPSDEDLAPASSWPCINLASKWPVANATAAAPSPPSLAPSWPRHDSSSTLGEQPQAHNQLLSEGAQQLLPVIMLTNWVLPDASAAAAGSGGVSSGGPAAQFAGRSQSLSAPTVAAARSPSLGRLSSTPGVTSLSDPRHLASASIPTKASAPLSGDTAEQDTASSNDSSSINKAEPSLELAAVAGSAVRPAAAPASQAERGSAAVCGAALAGSLQQLAVPSSSHTNRLSALYRSPLEHMTVSIKLPQHYTAATAADLQERVARHVCARSLQPSAPAQQQQQQQQASLRVCHMVSIPGCIQLLLSVAEWRTRQAVEAGEQQHTLEAATNMPVPAWLVEAVCAGAEEFMRAHPEDSAAAGGDSASSPDDKQQQQQQPVRLHFNGGLYTLQPDPEADAAAPWTLTPDTSSSAARMAPSWASAAVHGQPDRAEVGVSSRPLHLAPGSWAWPLCMPVSSATGAPVGAGHRVSLHGLPGDSCRLVVATAAGGVLLDELCPLQDGVASILVPACSTPCSARLYCMLPPTTAPASPPAASGSAPPGEPAAPAPPELLACMLPLLFLPPAAVQELSEAARALMLSQAHSWSSLDESEFEAAAPEPNQPGSSGTHVYAGASSMMTYLPATSGGLLSGSPRRFVSSFVSSLVPTPPASGNAVDGDSVPPQLAGSRHQGSFSAAPAHAWKVSSLLAPRGSGSGGRAPAGRDEAAAAAAAINSSSASSSARHLRDRTGLEDEPSMLNLRGRLFGGATDVHDDLLNAQLLPLLADLGLLLDLAASGSTPGLEPAADLPAEAQSSVTVLAGTTSPLPGTATSSSGSLTAQHTSLAATLGELLLAWLVRAACWSCCQLVLHLLLDTGVRLHMHGVPVMRDGITSPAAVQALLLLQGGAAGAVDEQHNSNTARHPSGPQDLVAARSAPVPATAQLPAAPAAAAVRDRALPHGAHLPPPVAARSLSAAPLPPWRTDARPLPPPPQLQQRATRPVAPVLPPFDATLPPRSAYGPGGTAAAQLALMQRQASAPNDVRAAPAASEAPAIASTRRAAGRGQSHPVGSSAGSSGGSSSAGHRYHPAAAADGPEFPASEQQQHSQAVSQGSAGSRVAILDSASELWRSLRSRRSSKNRRSFGSGDAAAAAPASSSSGSSSTARNPAG